MSLFQEDLPHGTMDPSLQSSDRSMTASTSGFQEEPILLQRAAAGDEDAAATLLDQHALRIRRMVEARLDRRLCARVGVSDVLQEVNLEVVRRVRTGAVDPQLPFFLWLRMLTAQHLARLCRRHLIAERRDVRREVHDDWDLIPSSADCLAKQLAADLTSPTQALSRAERRTRVRTALAGMESIDREVLSLRHFEQLTNLEVARELGIEPSAASKRHLRALNRLREALEDGSSCGGTHRP